MAKLSSILRSGENNHLTYWCPGCKIHHAINYGLNRWGWNGNVDKPTFTPSIKIASGHFASDFKPGDACWCTFNRDNPDKASFKCSVCHSFITNGKISFLSDSTHELAGQIVDMVPLPGDEE